MAHRFLILSTSELPLGTNQEVTSSRHTVHIFGVGKTITKMQHYHVLRIWKINPTLKQGLGGSHGTRRVSPSIAEVVYYYHRLFDIATYSQDGRIDLFAHYSPPTETDSGRTGSERFRGVPHQGGASPTSRTLSGASPTQSTARNIAVSFRQDELNHHLTVVDFSV